MYSQGEKKRITDSCCHELSQVMFNALPPMGSDEFLALYAAIVAVIEREIERQEERR